MRLLDALVQLAAAPAFTDEAGLARRSPARAAAKIVQRDWRHLAAAVAALDPHPSDAALHHVRILAKRCRYAAEAVAPIAGPNARRLAAAVTDIQSVLSDHQDTVVAETWLRDTAAGIPAASLTAGQLIALERTRRRKLRAQWPPTWKHATIKKLHQWL